MKLAKPLLFIAFVMIASPSLAYTDTDAKTNQAEKRTGPKKNNGDHSDSAAVSATAAKKKRACLPCRILM
jgi:hypothetical protein